MVYFISDAHLGSRAFEHKRTQERKLVRFLDKIKDKADAVYLLGDMFDFWFEYSEVVPKGYPRTNSAGDLWEGVLSCPRTSDGYRKERYQNQIHAMVLPEQASATYGTHDSPTLVCQLWSELGQA